MYYNLLNNLQVEYSSPTVIRVETRYPNHHPLRDINGKITSTRTNKKTSQ